MRKEDLTQEILDRFTGNRIEIKLDGQDNVIIGEIGAITILQDEITLIISRMENYKHDDWFINECLDDGIELQLYTVEYFDFKMTGGKSEKLIIRSSEYNRTLTITTPEMKIRNPSDNKIKLQPHSQN